MKRILKNERCSARRTSNISHSSDGWMRWQSRLYSKPSIESKFVDETCLWQFWCMRRQTLNHLSSFDVKDAATKLESQWSMTVCPFSWNFGFIRRMSYDRNGSTGDERMLICLWNLSEKEQNIHSIISRLESIQFVGTSLCHKSHNLIFNHLKTRFFSGFPRKIQWKISMPLHVKNEPSQCRSNSLYNRVIICTSNGSHTTFRKVSLCVI